MKAHEACEGSPHKAAVRYTEDGHSMLFGVTHGRVFLQTSIPGEEPVFQEVRAPYAQDFLNYNDWKPWTAPIGFDDFLKTKGA